MAEAEATANEAPAAVQTPADAPTETAQDAINEAAETARQQAAAKIEAGSEDAPETAQEQNPDDAPITDWAAVDLGLPEGAQVSKEMLDSFGELAVEHGLSKKQASSLAKWQMNQMAEQLKAYQAEQDAALAKAWGKNREAKSASVVNYLQSFGQETCDMLKAAGAHENAAFLIFAEMAASRAGEDSLKSGSNTGGGIKPETALEGINAVFAETNGGRHWDGK